MKEQYHSVTSNSKFKENCPSGSTLVGQIIIKKGGNWNSLTNYELTQLLFYIHK